MGGGKFDSKAEWHKSSLVAEGTQRISTGKRNIEMPVKQEFYLSKDGKFLIVKMARQTPRGVMGTKQFFRKS